MKKTSLLFALAAFVGISQAQPYATWSRYRDVTVNASVTGAALTNYPVLVRLSPASVATGSNVLSDALANGADVRFTDSTGMTALSYEIDTWSSTGAAIWVRIPTIAAGATTKIRLYWGKTGSTTASNPSMVFDSAGGFVGVWHLGNAAGISPRPNAITGSPAATPANDVAAGSFGGGVGTYIAPAGQIGNGDAFRGEGTRTGPGTGADYLDIGSPAGFVAGTYDGTNTFTGYSDFSTGFSYSVWVKPGTPSGAYTYLLELANANGNNRNIQIFRPATDPMYRYEHVNATSTTTANQKTTPSGSLVEGAWQHLTVTVGTGTTPSISWFIDGVRVQGPSNAGNALANILRTNAWIGKSNYNGDYYWTGAFDESRLSRVARDSNWVKLDYATQRSGSTALALGTTTPVSATALYYPQKNPIYMINDSVSNVPVTSSAATAWGITGTLPAGLAFNTTTGAITGKVTAATASVQIIVNATVSATVVKDTLNITVSAGTPPGAPTTVTGVRASKTVTLSWAAPVVTGTSAITGYRAMVVGDSTAKFCTTTGALTCAISGLTNGTAYTFYVRAINAAGSSALSAASAAVTPAGVPGAPTGLVITPLSSAGASGTATLTWVAPASDSGSAIIEYYGTSTPPGAFCYLAMPAPLSCTVTGLVYGTPYTVSVYALNGIGAGPNSASVAITSTGIRPGSRVIRVSGSARPFTFVIPEAALEATEKVTMSISDVWGRTVWSTSVNNPKANNVKEISWNGKASNGRVVSAGMYVVKIATTTSGMTTEFTEKAVTLK